jgi:Rod binding domain-containing protein
MLTMMKQTPGLAMTNPNNMPVQPKINLSRAQQAKLDAAARDFEAVYISEMIKPMFDTVKTDKLFGGGKAEDTFKSLLMQQYGRKIAEAGGIGLAQAVKTEMIRMQEAAREHV